MSALLLHTILTLALTPYTLHTLLSITSTITPLGVTHATDAALHDINMYVCVSCVVMLMYTVGWQRKVTMCSRRGACVCI